MKNTNFYPSIWQTLPNSLELAAHWESQAKRTQDLSLNYTQADQLKIAEMSLNINGFAVIDQQGNEIRVNEFTQKARLRLKGQHTGLFIKTRETVSLPKGEYKTVRFYLKPWDNRFILTDYSLKEIFDLDHIDFEIKGGMSVKAEKELLLRLRFDFKPYSFVGLSRLIKRKLLGKMKPNLAANFAN